MSQLLSAQKFRPSPPSAARGPLGVARLAARPRSEELGESSFLRYAGSVTTPDGDITRLLGLWADGDQDARDRLIPLVYDELKSLARAYMRRERAGHTLQPTALVHEAILRFSDQGVVPVDCRAQFMGLIARTMRRVLVDHARRHRADKRGGDVSFVALDEARDGIAATHADIVELDSVLTRLAKLEPRLAAIVEARVFGGFEVQEVAEMLEISPATVKRDWTTARAWLHRELSRSGRSG